jgi:DNA polymerase
MLDSAALSALNWWTEAGVDTLVDDAPRDWLTPAKDLSGGPSALPPAQKIAERATLPETLEAFRAFLLSDGALPGASVGRIDAAGDAASGIAIVVDMPEAEDRTSGKLLSGEIGALFDRMLSAIKLDRSHVYLIPFSPVRPTSQRLGAADIDKLSPLLRHHLALAAPRKVLLLGDAPVQALLGQPAIKARDTVHHLTIGQLEVPIIATIHPRLVNLRRDYRPLVWADLQRFEAL